MSGLSFFCCTSVCACMCIQDGWFTTPTYIVHHTRPVGFRRGRVLRRCHLLRSAVKFPSRPDIFPPLDRFQKSALVAASSNNLTAMHIACASRGRCAVVCVCVRHASVGWRFLRRPIPKKSHCCEGAGDCGLRGYRAEPCVIKQRSERVYLLRVCRGMVEVGVGRAR